MTIMYIYIYMWRGWADILPYLLYFTGIKISGVTDSFFLGGGGQRVGRPSFGVGGGGA